MLAPKSIALLVAGIIIITALFSVFHVTYPTGDPVLPPIKLNHYQLFKYQIPNNNFFGNSTTSFTPTSNGTVTIEGYVYGTNSTGTAALGSKMLYVAAYPAETDVLTSQNGFYQITLLKYGKGTFVFQVPGYNPDYVKLNILGGSYFWLNLTLHQAEKYTLSGKVVDTSGNNISSVGLLFNGIPSANNTTTSSGSYNVSLYNGTYLITATKKGYSSTPVPDMVTISGKSRANFTITLQPLTKLVYYVSGYIKSTKGQLINGAVVTSNMANNYTTSNSSGFYKLHVGTGLNIITAAALGYGQNYTQVLVQQNMTDINLTLPTKNPFPSSGSGSTGSGLSGLPPGAATNITGTLGNATGGGSSQINYGNNTSQGSGSKLTLSGNVTDKNNSAPVALTGLYFYINVNGSYFYSQVVTNPLGHYVLNLNYTGHYVFFVYSPLYENYTFSIWINSSQTKDFQLIPLLGHNFLVHGHMSDASTGTAITGSVTAYLYNTNDPVLMTNTNASGSYSFYLVEGNYTFLAAAVGYSPASNSTSSHPLLSDVYENFSLTKQTSLGSNITQWGGTGSTGLPGVSSGNISSQLGNASGGSSPPTGGNPLQVTLNLKDASNGQNLSNLAFELYIKFNSQNYIVNNTTNAKGNSTIDLPYEGNYTFLVESTYYYGLAESYNITGDMNISMNLFPRAVHQLSVLLVNGYNYSRSNGNLAVPANTLYINNYKQGLNTPSAVEVTGVGTYFNYSAPDGNYTFVYDNVNYVAHTPFNVNISGASNSTTQYIKPYLIVLNSSSVTQYTFTLSPLVTTPLPINAGSSISYAPGTASTTYVFTASLGNDNIASRNFTLTSTTPVELLNLTVGQNSATVGESNINVNQTRLELNVSYNYSVSENGYIYSLFQDYVSGKNGLLYMGSSDQTSEVRQTNITSGTYFNFTKYYSQTGGSNFIIKSESSYGSTSFWQSQFNRAVGSNMTVYYYTSNFVATSNSGGK